MPKKAEKSGATSHPSYSPASVGYPWAVSYSFLSEVGSSRCLLKETLKESQRLCLEGPKEFESASLGPEVVDMLKLLKLLLAYGKRV